MYSAIEDPFIKKKKAITSKIRIQSYSSAFIVFLVSKVICKKKKKKRGWGPKFNAEGEKKLYVIR